MSATHESEQTAPAAAAPRRVDRRAALTADIEFMPDTTAAFLEQSPRSGRLVLWAAAAFLAIGVTWASYAKLDEVTTGTGKVIPSRQVQVVQNLEGGIVSEILAGEGDIVDEGQVLLRIDDTRFSSSFRESRVRYLALRAKAARLRAEANATAFEAPAEMAAERPELVERERTLLDSRKIELANTVAILEQQIAQRVQELAELRARRSQLNRSYELVQQEMDMTEPLVAQGAISEVEVLRLRRQVSELRGELETIRHSVPRVQSQIAEAKRKLEEAGLSFRNKARGELNDVMTELSGISESNLALEDRVRRTSVRSPVRGTIKQLMVNTVGGVVQPGMDLIEIVPLEDTLLVEARIRPADIAFIHPGQKSVVKFTAYDFAIYGGLEASLERISADTITDQEDDTFYQVLVRTDRNFLGSEDDPLPLIPGMLTEVDILTGKKTVLHYLMKPVLRAKARALRER